MCPGQSLPSRTWRDLSIFRGLFVSGTPPAHRRGVASRTKTRAHSSPCCERPAPAPAPGSSRRRTASRGGSRSSGRLRRFRLRAFRAERDRREPPAAAETWAPRTRGRRRRTATLEFWFFLPDETREKPAATKEASLSSSFLNRSRRFVRSSRRTTNDRRAEETRRAAVSKPPRPRRPPPRRRTRPPRQAHRRPRVWGL